MAQKFSVKIVLSAAVAGSLAALAACAPKAPPPPPPPPPPMVVPPRPTPPNGASPLLITPPTDATGLRHSVNRNITPAQTLWNLRSGYNVAALNCMAPKHAEILTNYRAFLRAHSKTLAAANRKVDAEFRKTYGARFIAPREKYMTEVYNHFALPPTLPDFCDAVLAMSRDALTVKSADLEAFAARSLPNVEVVYDEFYRRYDAYKAALADWEARFGYLYPKPAPVAPRPNPAIVLPAVPPPTTTDPAATPAPR
ncbi:MAG TPA: hypothetical protein VF440_02120 [Novosphingobium sp.]